MKISSYWLLVLAILVTSAPTLAFADSDDAGGSYQVQEKQSSPASTQTGQDENGGKTSIILTISIIVLYITISAILGVVGYSTWKLYKVRSKIASRKLA